MDKHEAGRRGGLASAALRRQRREVAMTSVDRLADAYLKAATNKKSTTYQRVLDAFVAGYKQGSA